MPFQGSKDGFGDDDGVGVKDWGVKRASGANGMDEEVGVAWILMEKGVQSLKCTGVDEIGRGWVFKEEETWKLCFSFVRNSHLPIFFFFLLTFVLK